MPLAAMAQKSDLQIYVERCQTELVFQASEVKAMNCNDGNNFATASRSGINDYVVHQRVNQNVDAVAACRWGDGIFDRGDNTKFISLELLIHNRQNGGTCFFAAKDVGTDPVRPISPAIVSPTNFADDDRDGIKNADEYWLKPAEINSKQLDSNGKVDTNGDVDTTFKETLVCTRCHSQGPYIASFRVAPYLANFGLMNDRHDTFANFSLPNHYFVVGAGRHDAPDPGTHPFANWHHLMHRQNDAGNCSAACHTLSYKTPLPGTPGQPSLMIGDLLPAGRSASLLPSINTDRRELEGGGAMYPTADDSHYRWVSVDQPSSDSVEIETFTSSRPNVPVLKEYCGAPAWLEASATGSLAYFSTQEMSQLPDKLRAFSLREGLTCINDDQTGGRRCNNYQVSYKCGGPKIAVQWTPFYNNDRSNSDNGEHEERSNAVIQEATAWCDANVFGNNGKLPVAFRAQVVGSSTNPIINAPADRLAQFIPAGLVCRNSEQGPNQTCANYTVRYRGCVSKDVAHLTRMKNAWVSPPTFTNRYLTTTNNVDGAETRGQANNFQYPSQDWVIEKLANGTVRLRDIWSGKYLTALNNNDMAPVQVKNGDTAQPRQHWYMEAYNASTTEFLFRNVGTNRYLTVGNYSGTDPYFAPIYSQSWSNQHWASQRWIIN
jgi:hypothetical protein